MSLVEFLSTTIWMKRVRFKTNGIFSEERGEKNIIGRPTRNLVTTVFHHLQIRSFYLPRISANEIPTSRLIRNPRKQVT